MSEILDVLIVGYGPVGQMLSGLLGRAGHSVRVLERHRGLYGLSRAGRVDHEIMRILQSLGLTDELEPKFSRATPMALQDSEFRTMASIHATAGKLSGWHPAYHIYQPDLEDALDRHARVTGGVEVYRSHEVTRVVQHDDHVEVISKSLQSGQERVDRARYLVGADGANSIVRREASLTWDDLGYNGPWLVCDFAHNDPSMRLPFHAAFVCDPRRPSLAGRWLGRCHSRMEFLIRPDEDIEDFRSEEVSWALCKPFGLSPERSTLVRHAVYTFRSYLASEWRSGRVMLAGDAAHVMPPFMGQGMCSGIRDAVNLAWKLDLVLRDVAGEALLDQYTVERAPHVEQIIRLSMGIGELVSITDPEAASRRDAMLRSNGVPPAKPFPILVDGVLYREADGTLRKGVGALSPQSLVEHDGKRALLDDITGAGWRIVSRCSIDVGALHDTNGDLMDALDIRVARVSPASAEDALLDVDLDYETWFDEMNADVMIVRPDHCCFAVLSDCAQIRPALEDLSRQLHLVS